MHPDLALLEHHQRVRAAVRPAAGVRPATRVDDPACCPA